MKIHAEHNDTKKTIHTVLRKIYFSLYLKGSCVWEGVGDRTKLQHIDLLCPSGHSRVSFSFSWTAQPGAWGPGGQASLGHVLIPASSHQLVSKLTWGSRWPLLLGGGFLLHILSPTSLDSKLPDFLSSPSYIIVQSPTQHLWNGMFDCHQAEITVMQFTGHSLPVHQSMTVAWDFTLSHIVSQVRLRDFFS